MLSLRQTPVSPGSTALNKLCLCQRVRFCRLRLLRRAHRPFFSRKSVQLGRTVVKPPSSRRQQVTGRRGLRVLTIEPYLTAAPRPTTSRCRAMPITVTDPFAYWRYPRKHPWALFRPHQHWPSSETRSTLLTPFFVVLCAPVGRSLGHRRPRRLSWHALCTRKMKESVK